MAGPQSQEALREAVRELRRYLSGEIAPLMAVDSFETLAEQPLQLVAGAITEWVQAQRHGLGQDVLVSDLVYHAFKKLHLFSEFELVGGDPMMRHLQALSPILLQLCPADERVELKLRLSRLGESDDATASAAGVQYLHRGSGRETGSRTNACAPGAPREIRKLSLLLERLEKLGAQPGTAPDAGTDGAVLARALSTIALESASSEEMEKHLALLRERGVATTSGQMFRTLGWSLPGWMLPEAMQGQAAEGGASQPVQAMSKMVALAPDRQEGAHRLSEMVHAAIEQFNEGRLAQAVSIFEGAEKLIADNGVDAGLAQTVIAQAQNALSETALRQSADSPDKHPLLRKLLRFFPAYCPEALLERLNGEEKRDTRKLLLVLLECHGGPARDAVLARFATYAKGDVPDQNGFFKRNLIFLLRRIPRGEDGPSPEEMEHFCRAIAPGEPILPVREAIGALGALRHPKAERALLDRLKALEKELAAGAAARDETWDLLDRLCSALAFQATKTAIRSVVVHAFEFERNAAFGDALGRLEHLAKVDLSADPEQLAILLGAARDLLPSKVLGFVKKRPARRLELIVRAISGTATPEVRECLEEVRQRFPGQEIADEASRVLARFDSRARPVKSAAKTLNGDLELFAVPNLLQSLADQQANGDLVLFDSTQVRRGSLVLVSGRLASCSTGELRGESALYQILEKPFPGNFVFRGSGDGAGSRSGEGEAKEIMPLILEGVRRHDEYQESRAIVPDGARYEPTGVDPTPAEDEDDANLLKGVWAMAASGTPADVCEATTIADAYRIRRLYAHWLEHGSLRGRSSAP
jgi:hypothetical protein